MKNHFDKITLKMHFVNPSVTCSVTVSNYLIYILLHSILYKRLQKESYRVIGYKNIFRNINIYLPAPNV